MKTLTRNTPVWFKRLPSSEDSKANATFIRSLGVVKSTPVVEIEYLGNKWIVRESEILAQDTALEELADRWWKKIDEAKEPNQLRKDLAKKLGYSTSTLSRRTLFINKFHAKLKSNATP